MNPDPSNATPLSPTTPAPSAVDLAAEVVRLNEALEIALARAEAAIAFTSLVDSSMADYQDRIAIVDDVVACWRGLDQATREGYRDGRLGMPPVGSYAWDYADEVEARGKGDPGLPGNHQEALRAIWAAHVQRLRARQAPPAAAGDPAGASPQPTR